MKKILILALALIMAFSMTLSVYAEDVANDKQEFGGGSSLEETDTTPIDITIQVNGGATSVYSIDIEFGSMDFSYSSGLEWDPESYEYVPTATDPTWSAGENGDLITIKNYSDQPIYIAATIENLEEDEYYGGISFAIEGDVTSQIAACTVGDTAPQTRTIQVTVSGAPNRAVTEAVTLGRITVTISGSPITQTVSE